MVEHLSYSSVSTLLRCPRQWKYRYMDKFSSTPSSQLIAGSVYHKAVAWMYVQAMVHGERPSDEELRDVAASFWDAELAGKTIYDPDGSSTGVEFVMWGDVPPGQLKDRIVAMAVLYSNKIAPAYRALTVEQKYTMDVEGVGVPIIAFLDLTAERVMDGAPLIIDHKFRARSAPEQALANDFQSTFYTMESGIADMEFHEALNQKLLGFNINPIHRSKDDEEWAAQLLRDAWAQIQSGIFPPNPFNFLCSPEHCSYYAMCKLGW